MSTLNKTVYYDTLTVSKLKVGNVNNQLIIQNTDNKNIREKISFDSIFWIYYYLIYDKNNYILNNKNFKLKKDILYKKIENINNFKLLFQLNSYYKKNKIIDNLSSDDDLVNYCKNNKIDYYRGSLNNVLSRFTELLDIYKSNYERSMI